MLPKPILIIKNTISPNYSTNRSMRNVYYNVRMLSAAGICKNGNQILPHHIRKLTGTCFRLTVASVKREVSELAVLRGQIGRDLGCAHCVQGVVTIIPPDPSTVSSFISRVKFLLVIFPPWSLLPPLFVTCIDPIGRCLAEKTDW